VQPKADTQVRAVRRLRRESTSESFRVDAVDFKMAIGCVLREGNDGPRSNFFMRTLTGAITALLMVAGLATPAIPQARTSEPSAAELPFARSRDGIRETYIVSFGLFGPESVFASEAEKAAEILRARLQPDARLLVRFNHKRGGSATSATLAAALRSAGHAMDLEKDVLVVFLTSHGSPDGLAVVAGRRSETLSPRSFRSMLNASGARYRVVIISACYSGVFARANEVIE
jgi:Peptidase C13 family